MARDKTKKYSSIQRYEILPNKYRVKNYIEDKWIYIIRKNNSWVFLKLTFKNMTELNSFLNNQNTLHKINQEFLCLK